MPGHTVSQPHVVRTLRNLIWYHLDNGMFRSAIFAAERLLAQDAKCQEAAHLLALCYYRNQQYKSAEHIASKFLRHLGCVYIFAQCCLVLGEGREKNALIALEKCKAQWLNTNSWDKHTDSERTFLPDAAAVYQLIARLYESQKDARRAAENYAYAVRHNPFMWESFERLCELGTPIKAKNVFKQTPEMLASIKTTSPTMPPPAHTNHHRTASENLPDIFTSASSHPPPSRERTELGNPSNNAYFLNRLNEGVAHGFMNKSDHETASIVSSSATSSEIPRAAVRKTRAGTSDNGRTRLGTKIVKDSSIDASKRSATADPAAPARRSTRLLGAGKLSSKFASSGVSDRGAMNASKEREAKKLKSSIATRSRSQQADGSKPALSYSDTNSSVDVQMTDAKNPTVSRAVEAEVTSAHVFLLDLYRRLGSGFLNLNSYRCSEALQEFSLLPPNHRDTAWVLCKIGKTYYEMACYIDAEKAFIKARNTDPTRTEDMEVYSTLLWHLRKEVELSHLAHELNDLDRLSPQAWCAVGNSFSLQREHDHALKCFKRATQLDPKFAYAYTLQGHEHVSNEEYEKALCSYRTAMSVENRHYNAWYGLGKVYDKLGKYEMAERHFRTAAQINPANSVLVCCIGTILEQLGDVQGALEQYNRACALAPNSILSRFKKARILMELQSYRSALIELLTLKDLAPDESKIHFALGNIYKKLRDKTNAIKHFTIALNLDPKAGHLIKEAIETLEDDELDDA